MGGLGFSFTSTSFSPNVDLLYSGFGIPNVSGPYLFASRIFLRLSQAVRPHPPHPHPHHPIGRCLPLALLQSLLSCVMIEFQELWPLGSDVEVPSLVTLNQKRLEKLLQKLQNPRLLEISL